MVAPLPQINIPVAQGYHPEDVQSARDQLTMQTAPQINSINGIIQQIQGYLDRDIAAQQQFGTAADQKIAAVGEQLGQFLQGNVGKIGDIYNQGQQQVGAAYQGAENTMGNVGKQLAGYVQNKADLYGQQTTTPGDQFNLDPLQRMAAEGDILKGQFAAGGAAAKSNLATLGTQMQGIAQKTVGDEARNYAQKRGDLASQVLGNIGKLQLGAQSGTMEQLREYASLAQTAPAKFRQMLTELSGGRAKATAEAQQQAFENQLALAKLMPEPKAADPLGDYSKQLDILQKEKDLGLAPGEKGYAPLTEAKGIHGVREWMKRNNKDGHFRSSTYGLINEAAADYMPGFDPLAEALTLLNTKPRDKKGNVLLMNEHGTKQYAVPMAEVAKALQIYFGKMGTAKSGKTNI